MEQLKITEADLQSSLWFKIRAYYELQLADLRKQNDSLNIDEKTRSYLVGRIHENKTLLEHDPKATR